MKDGLINWAKDLITSNDFSSLFSVAGNLKFDNTDMKIVEAIWSGLFNFIALGLTLVYFIIEMNKKVAFEGQDMTMKSFFMPFLKLMIAILVVTNAGTIIGAILTGNNAIVNWATEAVKDGGAIQSVIAETTENNKATINANDYNLGQALFLLVIGFIIYAIKLFPYAMLFYKSIIYKLEVIFKLSITPVACADIYSGQNSNAIRWIKSIFALGIYGMAFVIIPEIGNMISIENTQGDGMLGLILFCVKGIIVPFAEVGLLSTAQQMCKEALA